MISVRPFDEKHAPALAEMMREMVRSYGAELPAGLNVEEELIGHARRIDMVVAFNQETLAGFATFTTLFPVRGLLAFTYIQQIYVGSTARRLGVAQRLMAAIAQAAQARGCPRLEWSTSLDNTAARTLYDGLGAIGSIKVQYVLEGEALDRLAAV